jgi:hypothetical protein
VLAKGSASQCRAKEDVSVTIHGDTLSFTNSALKKFTIAFNPSNQGLFGEIYAAEGGATVKISGHIIGAVLDADVTNYAIDPPCEHHWHLKKQAAAGH